MTHNVHIHMHTEKTHLQGEALLHATAGIVLVLGMTLAFQTKTEVKEIGVKTHAGQC